MINLLVNNPLLSIFVVAAVGYLVGSFKILGSRLGVAAVLFVGLCFGALDPRLEAPEVIFQLGLVFFVYSIGLASGKAFFDSFRQNGTRDILFVLLMLTLSGGLAVLLHFLFDFDALTTAGIYTGSTTNTPALAGVLDRATQQATGDISDQIQGAVVAYSFTYPMGVIASLVSIIWMEKLLKVDYKGEKKKLRKQYPLEDQLTSCTVIVENTDIADTSIRDLLRTYDWNVKFGRIKKEDNVELTNYDTVLQVGDQLMVVGSAEELGEVIEILGHKSKNMLDTDRSIFDVRRIFVSRPDVVGVPLSTLDLQSKFNAVVTRIRRGDVDMLASNDTILELGDRVRFVARREDLRALSTYFGDSYYRSSQVNLFSFGLGIALGLLLGLVQFSLPGGVTFKLGFAGGPLIVGLILGSLYRTGPIVWTLPYSTNVTLRQIGLILLLAVIGLRSGSTFFETLQSGDGSLVFISGTIISMLTAMLTLWIGYKLIKIPFSLLTGFVSNQPAILEFALQRAGNRIPLVGYSLMFPIALITKIIYAQVIFLILS
jgi:putative transport protein